MSLDIDQVAQRLFEASAVLAQRERTRRQAEDAAYALFARDPVESVHAKIKVSGDRLRLPTPEIVERLTTREAAAPAPDDYVALAADGSVIDIDRHRALPCYVLNIGAVELQYGAAPRCALTSRATLGLFDGDLAYLDQSDCVSLRRVDSQLLGVEQGIQELTRLADLLEATDPALPTLALVDGPLVIWGLTAERVKGLIKNANEGDFIRRYQAAMDRLQILARDRPLAALAGYVSYPGSDQVANLIRVAACPFPV
ncbi:MAG: DNA double-strand break repair nuclease NurA, partial [Dehalococcoidia bacterium]|nr:DNA double-strand break repair nuclease NurA [Dehalococcoidia bacterium]